MLRSASVVIRILTSAAQLKNTQLIWGAGVLFRLPSFKSAFVDYVDANVEVKDVTKINKLIGTGTTLYKMVDVDETAAFRLCICYHLLTNNIRLFSSQTYHELHSGH